MASPLYPHLRSMTGQGHVEVRGDAGVLVIELRSVNNRGLKVIMRTNESLTAHESDINKMVSASIQRGTVTVHATLKPPPGEDLPRIHHAIALSYAAQLGKLAAEYMQLPGSHPSISPQLDFTNLLSLPGVLNSNDRDTDPDNELAQTAAKRELLQEAVQEALSRFNDMRHLEAVAMAKALQLDLELVASRLALIESLAPSVIDRYRSRLLERIEKTLAELKIETEKVDIIREVQIFADRSDISEEITRLASHIELFKGVLDGNAKSAQEAVGRKLDFIVQELFRETNTIGSKAGNADIAEHVVEIKCAIERMRELVQNLE